MATQASKGEKTDAINGQKRKKVIIVGRSDSSLLLSGAVLNNSSLFMSVPQAETNTPQVPVQEVLQQQLASQRQGSTSQSWRRITLRAEGVV